MISRISILIARHAVRKIDSFLLQSSFEFFRHSIELNPSHRFDDYNCHGHGSGIVKQCVCVILATVNRGGSEQMELSGTSDTRRERHRDQISLIPIRFPLSVPIHPG